MLSIAVDIRHERILRLLRIDCSNPIWRLANHLPHDLKEHNIVRYLLATYGPVITKASASILIAQILR